MGEMWKWMLKGTQNANWKQKVENKLGGVSLCIDDILIFLLMQSCYNIRRHCTFGLQVKRYTVPYEFELELEFRNPCFQLNFCWTVCFNFQEVRKSVPAYIQCRLKMSWWHAREAQSEPLVITKGNIWKPSLTWLLWKQGLVY